jgi:hypothetical protein
MVIENGFEIENGVLVKYNGFGGDVVIPESVTSIEKEAFCGCHNLKTVDFAGAIPKLGSDVFDNCPQLALKPEIYLTKRLPS